MRIDWACRSDVGVKRSINEDNYRANQGEALFLVADGMGGHAGGELASRLTVETMERFVVSTRAGTTEPLPFAPHPDLDPESNRLYVATRLANREVYDAAVRNPALAGMGTTVVGLLLHRRNVHIVHVGDSRCYRYRGGKLTALTRDHSYINELINTGQLEPDAAYRHSDKNIITRALGVEPDLEPEMAVEKAAGSDLYLLCSDGLTDLMSDRKLTELLDNYFEENQKADGEPASYDNKTLGAFAASLVRYANNRGGDDNITVMLVQLSS